MECIRIRNHEGIVCIYMIIPVPLSLESLRLQSIYSRTFVVDKRDDPGEKKEFDPRDDPGPRESDARVEPRPGVRAFAFRRFFCRFLLACLAHVLDLFLGCLLLLVRLIPRTDLLQHNHAVLDVDELVLEVFQHR